VRISFGMAKLLFTCIFIFQEQSEQVHWLQREKYVPKQKYKIQPRDAIVNGFWNGQI